MKIAVIGSGISGLTSAYLLSRRFEVHLFEAAPRLGGHTHTVDVKTQSGTHSIDTGFIVFNDWTYPLFIKLMSELGVPHQPSSMSFSVKTEAGGLEYNGTDLNGLFAQRSNLVRPSFLWMIRDILRFNREAALAAEDGSAVGLTLKQYLDRGGYSKGFLNHYIIPMGAAIWSASSKQMEVFPFDYFARFFKNHGMLSVDERPTWRVIQKGSRSYIDPITRPFRDKIHLASPVERVVRNDTGVKVTVAAPSGRHEQQFDQVVFASHADETLRMLGDPTEEERRVLSAFSYQPNDTVLHTDVSVLPKKRRAWAAWNYWLPASETNQVAVTYNMNILQGLSAPETFCVSLNMSDRIDPTKVLKKILYHHPVYTREAVEAQKNWGAVSDKNKSHFCGAYWGYGFHEDGVKSAVRVSASLGVNL
jgi:predicted NAD/FAD-binding protein